MAVDTAGLTALASFEDPRLGIRERFLTPRLGGASTVAVLSTPLSIPPRQLGVAICHSWAVEHVALSAVEVTLARALAGAGFPTVRYHAPGYGDSQAPLAQATLASHVDAAAEVARLLASEAGSARVGLIGARLGGSIAAGAASRGGVSALGMWDPAVDGARYLRSLERFERSVELTSGTIARARDDDHAGGDQHGDDVPVQGHLVPRATLAQLTRLNLLEVGGWPPDVLVLQTSRGHALRPELEDLRRRMEGAGSRVRFSVIRDLEAGRFGLPRFVGMPGGGRVDTQGRLSAALVRATVAWCEAISAEEGPAR